MKNILISASILIAATSVYAEVQARNPRTYLCSASYLYRRIIVAKVPGMTVEDSAVDVISTFASDFSGSLSSGGASIMGTRPTVEIDPTTGKKAIFEEENKLTDREGNVLSLTGIYNNGDKNFEFEVTFYESKTQKKVGKTLKFNDSALRITRVKPNEYIQVSCSVVERIKVNN